MLPVDFVSMATCKYGLISNKSVVTETCSFPWILEDFIPPQFLEYLWH